MTTKAGRRLTRGINFLSTLGLWVSGVFLAFTVGSITVDVFMRYYLNMPLVWLTEIIETMMLYITFLGGAWVAGKKGHVTVDLFSARWTPRNQRRSEILSCGICCFVCAVLIVFGSRVVYDYYVRQVHSMTVLELPVYPMILVIPVGSLMMLCQFAVQLAEAWRGAAADQDG